MYLTVRRVYSGDMSQSADEDQGTGEWHIALMDDGWINVSFDLVSVDGVESFTTDMSPDAARRFGIALINFADDAEGTE